MCFQLLLNLYNTIPLHHFLFGFCALPCQNTVTYPTNIYCRKLADQYQAVTIPTPPASPNEVQINSRVPQLGPHTVSVEHINSMSRDPTASQILPERTWQQCFCVGSEKTIKEEGNWDFVEPARKTLCTCVK